MKTSIPSLAFIALLVLLSACLLPGLFTHGKRLLQTLTRRRFAPSWSPGFSLSGSPRLLATNIAEATHCGGITKKADAALTTRFLLVKTGSDADHVAACGANNKPLGVCNDEAEAANDNVHVQFLNATGDTRKVVASEAIANDADLYTAAGGKVQDEPASAGTYYRIGKARSAAGADGDVIEAELHAPVLVVVIAALTSTNGTAAGAADLNALKAEAEKIGDDVRAIAAALAAPAEVKVLAS